MMKKRIFLLLFLFSSGCVRTPLVENLLDQPTRDAPTDAVFYDDFSETDSGWDRLQTSAGSTDYEDKAYQIVVDQPNTDLFANPGLSFKDVIVEVNGWRVNGPANNSFGVICRYRDAQNFYAAQVSSDGYAGIFRMKGGKYELLGLEKMIPVSAILGGSAVNRIQFECVGSALILSVNGSPVDYREDDSFESGDVGLIAGSFEKPGVNITFDDFRVTLP